MKRFLLFILAIPLICLTIPSVTHADEPQLQVRVDKANAQLNEEIHLNIKVTGARGTLPPPKLPSLEAFEVFYSGRASHFSFVNGRSESMTEFNYVLIPKSVGTFILRPIEVTIDNQVYKSDQLEIRIDSGSSQARPGTTTPYPAQGTSRTPAYAPTQPRSPQQMQQQPPAQAAAAPADIDQNIFLRVTPTKQSVYTNEQLILNYSLMTRYDTRYEGFEEEPETSGFWIEEFPLERDIGKDTEIINGRKYVRADIKKLALFPTAPGQYTIKPGVIKTSVQIEDNSSSLFDEFFNDSFFSGGGLFARRISKPLTHPPIQIQVKALPEAGKPKSFAGAVGEYRMTSTIDKRAVKQNEPVTITVVLEGEGNIETLTPPKLPEIANTKTYPADTKTERFSQKDRVAGRKTIEMIVIPQQAGSLSIPGLEFSFFNPKIEQYVILKTDAYQVQVEVSNEPAPATPFHTPAEDGSDKKEIRSEGEDIQYIKLNLERNSFPLKQAVIGLGTANILLTILSVLFFWLKQRNEYLDQNVALKRSLGAKKQFQQSLAKLQKLSKNANDVKKRELFYDECAKILSQYMGNKLGYSAQALTQHSIQIELERRNVDAETISSVRDVFEACDQVRFGRLESASFEPQAMIERLKKIVDTVEKK